MLTSVLTGLSILIVGDSHLTTAHTLIESLHSGLEQNGAEVRSLGVCGSNAGDWLQTVKGTCGAAQREPGGEVQILDASAATTTPIDALITRYKPDLLVIVMGDTMAGYKDASFPRAWAWQQVTSLTKEIAKADTRCIWIGPAWGSEGSKFQKSPARTQQISSFLASNVAPCEYIDSLKLSKPGEWATTDGQHLTRSGYQAWGQALTQQILQSPIVKKLEKK